MAKRVSCIFEQDIDVVGRGAQIMQNGSDVFLFQPAEMTDRQAIRFGRENIGVITRFQTLPKEASTFVQKV